MPLTDFEIIHARAMDGDPEICCMDGPQRVVAHVAREAWNDYFELPPGQTLRTAAEGNILAHSNTLRGVGFLSFEAGDEIACYGH